eukprot:UN08465
MIVRVKSLTFDHKYFLPNDSNREKKNDPLAKTIYIT